MNLSIVHPILNSHDIVRRQILHYDKMCLPDFVEVILVDDGSDPPLSTDKDANFNLVVVYTHNHRPWTEHIARNQGARKAMGNYILLIDIDYIVPRETIRTCLNFDGDRMNFRRRFGVLDDNGDILYDLDTLKSYQLKDKWLKRRKRFIPGHRSQFLIRKNLFWELGGYNELLDGVWRRTGGAGERFWRKWQRAEKKGLVTTDPNRPTVFMFPSGKFCNGKSNLFHSLEHSVA